MPHTQVELWEPSGYEASIDGASLDGTWTWFSQIYTQSYTSKSVSVCRSYTATAPGPGTNKSVSIPAAQVQTHGGVGYAGTAAQPGALPGVACRRRTTPLRSRMSTTDQ
ncbi:MAG: hypothetical protein R2706_19125 [Acidimicrobiales bacterium]